MADQKVYDIAASMRLYYDDERYGLTNVCAEAGHVGCSARSEEFDFNYARYTYYNDILHAAQVFAAQGRKFDLHMDMRPDGLFPADESYASHLKYEQGVLMLDFWMPGGDIVYHEGPASTKAVLDGIDLMYGGFITACRTFTPDDIHLGDPDLAAPFKFFNRSSDLRSLVDSLDWTPAQHTKDLNSMIRDAESRQGSREQTAQPGREEPDR